MASDWVLRITWSGGGSPRRFARWIGNRTRRRRSRSRFEKWIPVTQPGFRTKSIVVVTTLLDAQQTTKEDLATLYRARWNNELDLRSIKSTMQMRVLGSKTPGLVRKEIWAHALAYNLIRTVMAQAAATHGLEPRSISFKGHANPGGISTAARVSGGPGSGTALTAVPRPTPSHRHASRGRSPRSLRAACEKAQAQSLQLADKTPRRDQTQDGERGYREVSAIRRYDRSAQASGHRRARRVVPRAVNCPE